MTIKVEIDTTNFKKRLHELKENIDIAMKEVLNDEAKRIIKEFCKEYQKQILKISR